MSDSPYGSQQAARLCPEHVQQLRQQPAQQLQAAAASALRGSLNAVVAELGLAVDSAQQLIRSD